MKTFIKIFVLACIFSACSEENPPTIDTLTILNNNSQIQKAEGAQLQFYYSFTDDNGLNRYKVSVIDDFPDARTSSAPWFFEEEYNLTGTSSSDTFAVTLPYPDIEVGRYKLTVTVQNIDQLETALDRTFYILE